MPVTKYLGGSSGITLCQINGTYQIFPLELKTKHCDICSKDVLKSSYKNHLQSQKHKNNEFKVKGDDYIENTDGDFKNHIKIRNFSIWRTRSIINS